LSGLRARLREWAILEAGAPCGRARGRRTDIFPLEGIDEVRQVFLQEIVDDAEGVFVGGGVKIKGAAKEVVGCIGKVELLGSGGVTTDGEKNAPDAIGRLDDSRLDRAGLISMFVGHFEGVVAELVESIGADVFIADIDRCAETGKVDIDPVGVFGNGIEETAITGDAGVDGIVKGIGIAGLIEGLVFVRGEIDLEIAFPFGGVGAVAGQQTAAGQGQNECEAVKRETADGGEVGCKAVGESRHGMVFIILTAI
jgi:hypothetical protein